MGSTVGDVVQRVKQRVSEDAQGIKQAYRAWKDTPSWMQVTSRQLGLGQKSRQERPTGKRKTSSQKRGASGR
jgi:hypothetical protein